jgi:hypothetical protein
MTVIARQNPIILYYEPFPKHEQVLGKDYNIVNGSWYLYRFKYVFMVADYDFLRIAKENSHTPF